ncbi:MAG: DUF3833 family protein [Sphingomicrobium sp.]
MRVLLPPAAASLLAAPATASPPTNPMQFFEGRTEGTGTVRILLDKPYRTRSVGQGRFVSDGSMLFVQRVEDEGQPPRERRWKIRQVGSRQFSGTMSEALGPVTIDEVGGRFRFRFKMKGNLSIEQWLIPLAGGKTARNSMRVRKFGVTVGTSEGMIRKIASR